MSRFEKRVVLVLALLIIVLSALEAMAPKPTDWSPSFSQNHRKPYGGQLVYERLKDLFPNVRSVHDPVAIVADDAASAEKADGPINLIYVNSSFALDKLDTERLLGLAAGGDHVLIAADRIDGQLADTLHLRMDRKNWLVGQDTSDIRFIGEQRIAEGVFRYARGFPGAYFTRFDTSRTRVLAVDGASHPVLLHMRWGQGRIVLCSAPLAFSNYNLLKNRNVGFMAGALSLLPPNPVLWDEYYKAARTEASTPLRYILSQPALRWAWYLTLGLVLLFMIVHARRQQRAIPIVAPPRNATRELMHTVGRLYWHKGDHAGLARKMIAYFKEDVRSRTYMRTFGYDEATIAHLATKTGLSREDLTGRLTAIQRREEALHLSETDLLALNTELHEFRQLI
ncbi:MAG: DUF4350 domain-containing protein [Flavobacteriales bacterium]